MCIWCQWCWFVLRSVVCVGKRGRNCSRSVHPQFLGMAVFMFCSILAWSTMRQQCVQLQRLGSIKCQSVKRFKNQRLWASNRPAPSIEMVDVDLRYASMLAVFHAESVCRGCASLAGANFGWWQNLRLTMTNGEPGQFRCNTCVRDQDLEAMNLDKRWLNAHLKIDSYQV